MLAIIFIETFLILVLSALLIIIWNKASNRIKSQEQSSIEGEKLITHENILSALKLQIQELESCIAQLEQKNLHLEKELKIKQAQLEQLQFEVKSKSITGASSENLQPTSAHDSQELFGETLAEDISNTDSMPSTPVDIIDLDNYTQGDSQANSNTETQLTTSNPTLNDDSSLGEPPSSDNSLHYEIIDKIGYTPNNSFARKYSKSFPYVKIPKKQSILKKPGTGYGRINRRGFTEETFESLLRNYFQYESRLVIISDCYLHTSSETSPYVPDICLHDPSINLYIDIEIDEPYDLVKRTPTHAAGMDSYRNDFFCDRGWVVVRFSEKQVHMNGEQCCALIASVIQSINSEFLIPNSFGNVSMLEIDSFWSIPEARRMEKENYRETYLGIKRSTFTNSHAQDDFESIPATEQEILVEKELRNHAVRPAELSTFSGYMDLKFKPLLSRKLEKCYELFLDENYEMSCLKGFRHNCKVTHIMVPNGLIYNHSFKIAEYCELPYRYSGNSLVLKEIKNASSEREIWLVKPN